MSLNLQEQNSCSQFNEILACLNYFRKDIQLYFVKGVLQERELERPAGDNKVYTYLHAILSKL